MERIQARPYSKETRFREENPVYFAASREARGLAQELAGKTAVYWRTRTLVCSGRRTGRSFCWEISRTTAA